MSQMPDSIYLHKDSKYNTSGDYFAQDEVRILSENEFDENALKDYVEYTPVYRLEEAIRKAEKDIISLIEFRISEILGDAQPNPVLRMELQGIIDKIKEK